MFLHVINSIAESIAQGSAAAGYVDRASERRAFLDWDVAINNSRHRVEGYKSDINLLVPALGLLLERVHVRVVPTDGVICDRLHGP